MRGPVHRRVVVITLLLMLLAAPAGASEDDAPPTDDEVEEEEVGPLEELRERRREEVAEARDAAEAAQGDLKAASAATHTARERGSAADGEVRDAEEDLPPALLARDEAEDELREARREVRSLRSELVHGEDELGVARERLVDRVVRAYKQGSVAADTAWPLLAAREAAAPGELAHALKDLEALALTGAGDVDALVDRLARVEEELTAALVRRQDAEVARQATREAVEDGEQEAAARRRAAHDAEADLLTAMEHELQAARARDTAREQLEAARARLAEVDDDADVTTSAAATEPDDDTTAEATADGLETRERAHRRQQSVDPERRRTADDWVCPVEGGSFVNDWAFPRSQDRRHEGTDVFAPTGAPILAVTDGTVVGTTTVDGYDGRSGFGGLTVTYEQDDERFYNAHLDAIHPDMEVDHEVRAGEVIGWVGRTGNARGTPPHLHLGWYVEDVAVNPYASLAVACHTEAEEGSGQR